MFRVGVNLLLNGGGLLHKGKSSAKLNLNGNSSLLTKDSLGFTWRKMVWITINDEKVNDSVDVMR